MRRRGIALLAIALAAVLAAPGPVAWATGAANGVGTASSDAGVTNEDVPTETLAARTLEAQARTAARLKAKVPGAKARAAARPRAKTGPMARTARPSTSPRARSFPTQSSART